MALTKTQRSIRAKSAMMSGANEDTGNKVSRRATIAGPQNIILGGKTIISSGAIIRGDRRRSGPAHAVIISLGRYCLVGEGCVLRPPYKTYRDHVHIGAGSIGEAATIGNYVEIGKNCVIIAQSYRSPEYCHTCAVVISGSPGHFAENLPESTQDIAEVHTKQHYARFQPLDRERS
ncbi:hypothetical protein BT96DRAFT_966544 [Gymnopus androsaceus JB14]|uniref:Dynactin subunit 5 n=1 Tax=Gymnopus androsaceus JB14 TaxID=1447944 RepID=A0A6A4HFZ2_9AGAR|nr:hypothetical protein BT96DRAFT_966544 [Gymnopus androsaceus JB14]